MGFSARCRACGNSRLCRNVVELASLPFLRNEGVCPKYTPSARVHCILERMLVSLTPKHPFSQFHPCQSVSEDRLFYEYDFSDKLGISFHEYLVPLFSVRVSLRTQRTSSVDPERPSSGRPRPHPRKVRPYPVETQVDPGRIRVGEPDWPASSRTDRVASG